MRSRRTALAALAVAGLGALGAIGASADSDSDGRNRGAIDTRADYTPFERFRPLAPSSNCPGEGSGRQANPFVIADGGEEGPDRYDQAIVAEESDPITAQPPQAPGDTQEDLYDMNTQNEFGKDAGRFLYRTHEVGGIPQDADPQRPGGAQVTVTDLRTGVTRNLARRNDFERFDGIAWTPWGTVLAAEETINQGFRDPQVPQASGGLVYELFVDEDDPSRLDPSRERITPGDGTIDNVQDGIRARPAVGAKAHEGLRFDERGFFYGIAESRGESQRDVTGGIFRFVPEEHGRGDDDDDDGGRSDGDGWGGNQSDNRLAFGQLSAYDSPNGKDGEGRWQNLDRSAVRIDADREAARQNVNRYERPEDVETGESTGVDRLNDGNTLYVAITDDGGDASFEEGVFNIDLTKKDRPFGYRYVGKQTGTIERPGPGNASEPEFNAPDNLALDRKGNLAITEDGGGRGDDIFIAAPPRGDDDDDGGDRRGAQTVQRFASIRDCAAEPTGVYFALEGTEQFSRSNPNPEVRRLVNGETLFVNRQHAGQTSPVDQGVAIVPVDSDDDDD